MARSTDTFFIRQSLVLSPNAINDWAQEAIDLGSFVDALGKSILRIKTISVQYTDTSDASGLILPAFDSSFTSFWQLTTQTQDEVLRADNRSLISSGSLTMSNNATVVSGNGQITYSAEVNDINPSGWSDGYLVATEAIYLGGLTRGVPFSGGVTVSVVLECEVTSMTQSAAMALALSQQ